MIKFFRDRILLLFLLLGLIIGSVFVFLVPPWMHYDEPGHFEYAWLIANRSGLPEIGDYDQTMRRQLGASLNEVNISKVWSKRPELIQFSDPIDIDIAQLTQPPLYYLYASLPLRIFKYTDITFQLYLVRLASLSLFLLIIWVSYNTCQELFGEKHPVVWMVPLFLITLASFVDIGTAANNDVAAVLAYSLFVWVSVKLIKKGLTVTRLAALLATIMLSILSKATAYLTIPLGLMVVIFAVFSKKKSMVFVMIVLTLGVFLAGLLMFSFNERMPAFFYCRDNSLCLLSDSGEISPVGETVIVYQCKNDPCMEFYALLSQFDRKNLEGKNVTLGAWIWSDEPTKLEFPFMQEVGNREDTYFTSEPIQLSTEPQFFAHSTIISPSESEISWITFLPDENVNNQVYWDGIILVEGDFSKAGPPIFDNAEGITGTWQGIRFENLIKNASGENTWPVFSGWTDFLPSRFAYQISRYLSITDTEATGWYYKNALFTLFNGFWGSFGWGEVMLVGRNPYLIFYAMTSIYLFGLLLGFVNKSIALPWQMILFLISAIVAQILIVFFRGANSWFTQIYLPRIRYFYPVIIPVSIFLVGGSYHLNKTLNKFLKIPKFLLYSAFVCFHVGLLIWAIFSIRTYYY